MRTVGWFMGVRVEVVGNDPLDDLTLNDGMADEQSGNVDGPGGHLSRIGSRLIVFDSDGNKSTYVAATLTDAEAAVTRHQEINAYVDRFNGEG